MLSNDDFEFLANETNIRNAVGLRNMLDAFISEAPIHFTERLEVSIEKALKTYKDWEKSQKDAKEGWVSICYSHGKKDIEICIALQQTYQDVIFWRPYIGLYAPTLDPSDKRWKASQAIFQDVFSDYTVDDNNFIAWTYDQDFPRRDGAEELIALTTSRADQVIKRLVKHMFELAQAMKSKTSLAL